MFFTSWFFKERLQVWLHEVVNSAKLGIVNKLIHSGSSRPQVHPEGFYRHIEPDSIPELKAVGYRLLGAVNWHLDPVEDVPVEPLAISRKRKPEHSHGRVSYLGHFPSLGFGNMNHVRYLACKVGK